MNLWLVMLIAGALTFLTRLSFIWLFEKMAVPPFFQKALRFVPPAVLAVIISQDILIRDGSLAISLGNTRLIAGIIAVIIAWRTRNALLTIAAGMVTLIVLNAIML